MLTVHKSGMAFAWLICSAAMAYAQTPTIVSAVVNSATKQITITGASLTGNVQVATPGGLRVSNVAFQVS